MSNILSEISLHDIIYKLKDDNAVTQEQLEEALGNIDVSSGIYIQSTEPENPKVGDVWIDTDDEGGEVLAAVATSGNYNDLINRPTSMTPTTHTHTRSEITDFPTSMPASDVSAWAKASTKPTYTASEVGADASGTATGLINRTNAVNAANTSYTTYMARGESLNSSETNPGINGAIAWQYA